MPLVIIQKAFNLGDQTARDTHVDICESEKSFALMFTLNKFMYNAPMHIQLNESKREIKKFYKSFIHSGNMPILMMTPELTKETNIHWHCYGTLNEYDEHIHQKIKMFLFRNKVMGTHYKFTMIDGNYIDKPTLMNYPFKDIKRSNQGIVFNCKPAHILLWTEQHNMIKRKVYNHQTTIEDDDRYITVDAFLAKMEGYSNDTEDNPY